MHYTFDHIFDHLQNLFLNFGQLFTAKTVANTTKYHRGVAQLVARLLWEQDAAGSSPVTSTISSVHNGFELWTLDFFFIPCMYRSRFACSFLYFRRLDSLPQRLFLFRRYSEIFSGRLKSQCNQQSGNE